ncbi:MAG: TlpA family protein disulfide reductase [Acidobacteriota bacterium]
MRRLQSTFVLTVALALAGLAAQSQDLIPTVRQAIAQKDFGKGEALIASYREARGVTPEMLAALSWMGRGNLADKKLDQAERFALETYRLSTAMLDKGPLDQEAHLPIALGAAIEVLAHVDAERGARSEAINFLNSEIAKHKGTSIVMRIQKNINLLSLEGTEAPALDLSEYIGAAPPTLTSLKGKVILMFFWAHWCPDCKNMAPVLANLSSRYGAQGLVVVAPTQRYGYVSRGKSAGPDEEKRHIASVLQASYPTLSGQPVPVTEANHLRYGVSTTPTVVVVDREGIIRRYHPGQMTEAALEPLVKRLVETPTRSR